MKLFLSLPCRTRCSSHAQQAVEKLLKALIAAHGEPFPYTHDIQLLLDQLTKLSEVMPSFSFALHAYTRFGVIVRYDHVAPMKQMEREEHRQVVGALRRFVMARIVALP